MKSLKGSKDWDLNSRVIQDLLIEGHSLKEISKIVELSIMNISRNYKPIKTKEYNEEVCEEASPSYLGDYRWEALSKQEIEAYNKYESKNKAYYD